MYTAHIRDRRGGNEILSLAGRTQGIAFAYNDHGIAEASIDVALSPREMFLIYDRPSLPHLDICYAGAAIHSTRLERPAIRTRGDQTLVGASYWNQLSDAPYTALWSDTRTGAWLPTLTTQRSAANPDMYAMDTNNRLFIALEKNTSYRNLNDYGAYYYLAPDQGARSIVALTFDYEMFMQGGWLFQINRFNSSYGSGVNVWSLNASGAVQTGSVTLTFTANDLIEFAVYNNTGAVYNNTAESGFYYARLTNVRVRTTTSSTVLASEIVPSVLAAAGMSVGTITTTTLDLRDELYEDVYPAEILEALGESNNMRATIDTGGYVSFQSRTANRRVWRIEASDLQVERTLQNIRNRRYATYKDANGRTLRTAAADDSYSILRYGITRSAPVAANTTSSSQATTIRDTALGDTANPPPRSRIVIRRLYDATGAIAALHEPRAGDTVIIGNLPAALTTSDDQIRSFTIARNEVQLQAGALPTLTMEPADPIPSLVTLLARIEEGA